MATIVVKNETCSTRTERGENKEITKNDDLGKLGILKNKSNLGWSGFASITEK